MANINLLPWRDEVREEKKREFISWLILTAILAGVLVFGWYSWVNKEVTKQEEQNSYVQAEIEKLNEKARVLDDLKKKRDSLLQRVGVIKELQGKRPKIVHVFDELTSLVPKGVFLTQIIRTADRLDITGTAESNNDVSEFMRQLDSSGWFAEPVLQLVKANEKAGERANDFSLGVRITEYHRSQSDDIPVEASADNVVPIPNADDPISEPSTETQALDVNNTKQADVNTEKVKVDDVEPAPADVNTEPAEVDIGAGNNEQQ